MGAVYIGLILLLRVAQNYYSKQASRFFPVTAKGRLSYLALYQGVSAVLALVLYLCTGAGEVSGVGVLIATASGVGLALAVLCSNLAMQTGTMMMTSLFGTAGLIVPCVAGVFLFHEPVSLIQWAGIAVFLVAAWLITGEKRGQGDEKTAVSLKTVLLLIGSFLANGLTMVCQQLFTYLEPGGSVSLFSLFTFAVPAVLCALAVPLRSRADVPERFSQKLWLPMVVLAVAVFLINQFATEATDLVPAAVLFTLINGGNTILAALVGAVAYSEKPGKRGVIGLTLGVAALIAVNAGG